MCYTAVAALFWIKDLNERELLSDQPLRSPCVLGIVVVRKRADSPRSSEHVIKKPPRLSGVWSAPCRANVRIRSSSIVQVGESKAIQSQTEQHRERKSIKRAWEMSVHVGECAGVCATGRVK